MPAPITLFHASDHHIDRVDLDLMRRISAERVGQQARSPKSVLGFWCCSFPLKEAGATLYAFEVSDKARIALMPLAMLVDMHHKAELCEDSIEMFHVLGQNLGAAADVLVFQDASNSWGEVVVLNESAIENFQKRSIEDLRSQDPIPFSHKTISSHASAQVNAIMEAALSELDTVQPSPGR